MQRLRNVWTIIFRTYSNRQPSWKALPFRAVESSRCKAWAFLLRAEPLILDSLQRSPRPWGIINPLRDIPRERATHFFSRKSTQALPPDWQDGRRGVLINKMPRTIEGSHYRGNTRANVNLFFSGSWSVTWPSEPRANTMLHVVLARWGLCALFSQQRCISVSWCSSAMPS